MTRYRKLPVTIDAFQLPALEDDNVEPFHQWAEAVGFDTYSSERDGCMSIATLEGTMLAEPGDWIIKGVVGEFYPCKDEIFRATYEPVPENEADLAAARAALQEAETEGTVSWGQVKTEAGLD